LSDIMLLSADTLCDQQCRGALKILVDSRPISFRARNRGKRAGGERVWVGEERFVSYLFRRGTA
jgi:hypothetical protein